MLLAGSMPSLGSGEHLRLIRDQTHSIIFMCGALAVAFGLIRVVCDDMRRGAGAILMSRPLSPAVLLSAKLFGIVLCTAMLVLTSSFTYLWISEIYYSPEEINIPSLLCCLLVISAALAAGAFRQYMYGSNFSQYSSLALCVFMGLGLAGRMLFGELSHFDLSGLQSLVLLFMALIVFASIILVVAVIADAAMVLTSSILLFFFGLLSEYFVGTLMGGTAGDILISVLPNWQMFWVLESLGTGQSVPFIYYLHCFFHVLLFVAVYLIISVTLFERIEIKGVT